MINIIDLTGLKLPRDRSGIRKQIIEEFLKEDPGKGKGEFASRYRYTTKILKDKRDVFLERPANFNNGFDFTVNVSLTNFNNELKKRASTRPTHSNILDDLKIKKEENCSKYYKLFSQIELIYQSQNVKKEYFEFTSGHPTELLLECIKWLFIEQDVTYWNYSGRTMLFNAIKKI